MSELVKWLRERKDKSKSTIKVPAAFSFIEESKIATLYKEKERQLDKKVRARAQHKLSYIIDEEANGEEKTEISYGDEVVRHVLEETAMFGGILGEKYQISSENFEAFTRLRTMLESVHASRGSDSPITQTLVRLLRNAKDQLIPRSIPRSDVDVERVTLPSDVMNPFANLATGGQLPNVEKKDEGGQ